MPKMRWDKDTLASMNYAMPLLCWTVCKQQPGLHACHMLCGISLTAAGYPAACQATSMLLL